MNPSLLVSEFMFSSKAPKLPKLQSVSKVFEDIFLATKGVGFLKM